jgi:hypothetical protein
LEQEDCYSAGDDNEDDDLDGFIVNDDEEPEQTEEPIDGKCLAWNSGHGRIRDIAQRLIFVSSFYIPTDSSSDEDSIRVDDSEDDDDMNVDPA